MAKKVKSEEIKATVRSLDKDVIEKRPAKTYTEILSKPKEQPADAPMPKHPYPESVVTELVKADLRPDKTEPPKLVSAFDFLKVPLGMLDLENAGVLFKNGEAPNNKKLIDQWNHLLDAGYVPTLRVVDNNYVYFQFNKT